MTAQETNHARRPTAPRTADAPPANPSASVAAHGASPDNSPSAWQQIVKDLKQVLAADYDAEGRAREVGKLLTSCPGVIASVYLQYNASGSILSPLPLVCRREFNHLAPSWEQPLLQLARRAFTDRVDVCERLSQGNGEVAIVASPVIAEERTVATMCMVVPADGDTLAVYRQILKSVAHRTSQMATDPLPASIEADHQGLPDTNDSTPHRQQPTPHLGNLCDALLEPDPAKALQRLADSLATQLAAARVFLGLKHGLRDAVRLKAVSGETTFDGRSALATCCEEVLSEAVVRGEVAWWGAQQATTVCTAASQELLNQTACDSLTSGPLLDRHGRCIGGWAAVGHPPDASAADVRDPVRPLFAAAGVLVELIENSRPSPCRRLTQSLGRRDNRQRRIMTGLAALTVLCLMLFPLPYHVKCACQIQPVTRRYVPVPYDGVLQEVLVQPGDVVRAGQVLARMDDREIQWELAGKQAEYERAKKQHDMSLAAALTADAQLARLEMERLDVQIQLLRDRMKNLEITSPIDGVVIAGDPSKRQGARLSQGETLFETGPLERMLVEIYVPDRDVVHVAENQRAEIRLDALPTRSFSGPLLRVSPSATQQEQENVFVAEIELDNPKHLLRPGMSGRGRVRTPRHALGWILFHRAWEAAVHTFG